MNLMKKRILSLDIFRGLTVALMLLVNNPGAWTSLFPALSHSPWDGCTLTDLVFPFFLFCVGASMVFSLARFDRLDSKALLKIFRRGVGIFLVGLFLNACYGNLSHLRIFGVLQRIALCYIAASLTVLSLRSPVKILAAIAVLSLSHVVLLLVFAGPEGAFTLEGCLARRLDLALVGEAHVYHGYRFADGTPAPFDPEGLLGVLTGTCTALAGYLAGTVLRSDEEPSRKIARLYTWAAVSLVLSQVLGFRIPINKPLWSVSYVFYTAGWAAFVLAFITWMTDVKGWVRPFTPLRAFGMNPLAIYTLAELLVILIGGVSGWIDPVLFLLFHLALAMILYKRNIVIKL